MTVALRALLGCVAGIAVLSAMAGCSEQSDEPTVGYPALAADPLLQLPIPGTASEILGNQGGENISGTPSSETNAFRTWEGIGDPQGTMREALAGAARLGARFEDLQCSPDLITARGVKETEGLITVVFMSVHGSSVSIRLGATTLSWPPPTSAPDVDGCSPDLARAAGLSPD